MNWKAIFEWINLFLRLGVEHSWDIMSLVRRNCSKKLKSRDCNLLWMESRHLEIEFMSRWLRIQFMFWSIAPKIRHSMRFVMIYYLDGCHHFKCLIIILTLEVINSKMPSYAEFQEVINPSFWFAFILQHF